MNLEKNAKMSYSGDESLKILIDLIVELPQCFIQGGDGTTVSGVTFYELTWDPVEESKQTYLDINTDLSVRSRLDLHPERREFWDTLYSEFAFTSPDWASERIKYKIEHIRCNERWPDWSERERALEPEQSSLQALGNIIICPLASAIYGFRDPSVLVGAEEYFGGLGHETSFPHKLTGGFGHETSFPHKLTGGLGQEISFPHKLTGGLGQETSFPHKLTDGLGHETSFPHKLTGGLGQETSFPHKLTGELDYETSFPHKLTDGLGHETSFPHKLTGGLGYDISFPHKLTGGLGHETSFPHKLTGGLGYDNSFPHKLTGGLGYDNSFPHKLTGGLGYDTIYPHKLTGGLGHETSFPHKLTGGLGHETSFPHKLTGGLGHETSFPHKLTGGLGQETSFPHKFTGLTLPILNADHNKFTCRNCNAPELRIPYRIFCTQLTVKPAMLLTGVARDSVVLARLDSSSDLLDRNTGRLNPYKVVYGSDGR
uniref:Uncharacterized protein n=1 Tax=Timema cristinae TaxID=61476 RepID=A0A7R9H2D9_TIMCR|nr:unnamed protein product [Timema cristinae]